MRLADFKTFFENRTPGIMEVRREFSVLIPLVEQDGQLQILFELRSAGIRQPGEVCFPGGMREAGESRRECAVRETIEELGCEAAEIQILGEFDCMHNYTNITIYPFVGQLSQEAAQAARDGKANPDEVQEVFWVPLEFFLNEEPYVYTYEVVPEIGEDFPYEMIDSPDKYNWRRGKCTVPVYRYDGHVIWGMTARIIRSLVEALKTASEGAEKGSGKTE